jgi:hypothetical protein
MDHTHARDSLDTISAAQRKAGELRNYRDAGSVVSAWGIVWFFGFNAQQFFAEAAPLVWVAGWVGAIGWTVTRPSRPFDMKANATSAVALVFVLLLLLAIQADMRTASMVFGLVVAASYAVLGIWTGMRFLFLGVIVLAAACASWWLMPQWLYLVLAVGGGVPLLIGGFWLRRP